MLLGAVHAAIELSRAALVAQCRDARRAAVLRLAHPREREVMTLVVVRPAEQASRVRTRHQRNHGEGASRPGHAKDEGGFAAAPGQNGCTAGNRADARPLALTSVMRACEASTVTGAWSLVEGGSSNWHVEVDCARHRGACGARQANPHTERRRSPGVSPGPGDGDRGRARHGAGRPGDQRRRGDRRVPPASSRRHADGSAPARHQRHRHSDCDSRRVPGCADHHAVVIGQRR